MTTTLPCDQEVRPSREANHTGLAFGVLVTSQTPHGILKNVQADSARSMPGVIGVWTGVDLRLAGCKPVQPSFRLPIGNETPVRMQFHYWLATERVRYVGEPVALVMAETVAQAKAAADAISVDIAPLHIVPDPRTAAALGALPLFDNASDNLCCEFRRGDYMDTIRAFDGAAHTTRLHFIGDRVDDMATAAEHQALTSYIAKQLQRPVELADDISVAHLSCAYDFEGELALESNGNFLALRITGFVGAGAYLEDATPLTSAFGITCNDGSAYRFPLVEVASKVLYTTTPPANSRSTMDQPEGNYFIERLIDQAARDLGIDRLELRRRNATREQDLPALLEKASMAADVAGFAGRKLSNTKSGTHRGLGIGTFEDVTASGNSFGVEVAEVEVDSETGTIRIVKRTLVHASDDGHNLQRLGGPIEASAKPAFANAIIDALGGRHIDVPAIPERVWNAVRAPVQMLGLY
jgi:carbon-monoxide dehydrogenase large subunit